VAALFLSIDFLNTLVTAGCWLTAVIWQLPEQLVGTVIAFLLYVQQFFRPINLKPVLYTGTIGSSRFRADLLLLDEPSQLKDTTDAVEMPPIRGEVSFFAVSFGYNPTSWFSRESHSRAVR